MVALTGKLALSASLAQYLPRFDAMCSIGCVLAFSFQSIYSASAIHSQAHVAPVTSLACSADRVHLVSSCSVGVVGKDVLSCCWHSEM